MNRRGARAFACAPGVSVALLPAVLLVSLDGNLQARCRGDLPAAPRRSPWRSPAARGRSGPVVAKRRKRLNAPAMLAERTATTVG